MDLPFSVEQFFHVFARYNLGTWPAPVVMNGLAVLALFFVYTQVPETRGHSLESLEESVSTGAIYFDIRQVR